MRYFTSYLNSNLITCNVLPQHTMLYIYYQSFLVCNVVQQNNRLFTIISKARLDG